MRLKTVLICSIFFLSNLIYSQKSSGKRSPFISSSFDSFKVGEWLKFRIHYGIFNASYATIDLHEDIINGEKVFKSIAIGRTTGIARLFFKVDDVYESYFNKTIVKPLKSKRDVYEGGYTKNVEIEYDYTNNIAIVNDIKHDAIKKVNIKENVQDIISTFYFLRNHFDVSKLQVNDFIRITMFLTLIIIILK